MLAVKVEIFTGVARMDHRASVGRPWQSEPLWMAGDQNV